MENRSIEQLRGEIAELEDQAARLSARRSQLHHRIDFGFETATTRDREREVSVERNELHERIDSLKEALRLRESAA
jgi:chromosome segregation ATPase